MCILKVNHNKCEMINRNKLGPAVGGVVTQAKVERRLICGLFPAISYLEKVPEDVLLCVLPQINPGDATIHMQMVLLQAFCYENYIPVIQVDNSEKLAEYCGIGPNRKGGTAECFCALITKLQNITNCDQPESPLSPSEQQLTDFYQCTLAEYPRPVIELPG